MKKLSLHLDHVLPFISRKELDDKWDYVMDIARKLHDNSGAGSEYLGWMDLPINFDREELKRVKEAAQQIKDQSEVLIVIGIGGSYLGAKATIEALTHSFYNSLTAEERDWPEIYFAGHNMSSTYLQHLIHLVGHRDFSINVISKSGTTTEPAIAFRIFKKMLEEKFGKEGARRRIFATTDRSKGALKQLSDQEGYTTFVVPDDVGGRFSVLTPVGLLPIAAAGIDVDQLLAGAREARDDFMEPYEYNSCYQYANARNVLYEHNKLIEMLIAYEPSLTYVAEWWKQLFGESEGKEGKGIYPSSAVFTTDLHSLGQYVQEGRRHLFETVIRVMDPAENLVIEHDEQDLDGLNYLAGKTVDFVNKKAGEGTLMAHVEGGVPNILISLPKLNAYHLGYLFYFFEKACAMSGYMLGVNPFDQPGVEAYKRNMFQLLGKKGY
jgi:glucose-6-phosphate isomerase